MTTHLGSLRCASFKSHWNWPLSDSDGGQIAVRFGNRWVSVPQRTRPVGGASSHSFKRPPLTVQQLLYTRREAPAQTRHVQSRVDVGAAPTQASSEPPERPGFEPQWPRSGSSSWGLAGLAAGNHGMWPNLVFLWGPASCGLVGLVWFEKRENYKILFNV